MQDLSTIRGDSSSTVPPSVTVRTSSKQSQPKPSRSASEGTGSSGKCRCYFQCCVVWNITPFNEVMPLAGAERNRHCRQHIIPRTQTCCWVSWHLGDKNSIILWLLLFLAGTKGGTWACREARLSPCNLSWKVGLGAASHAGKTVFLKGNGLLSNCERTKGRNIMLWIRSIPEASVKKFISILVKEIFLGPNPRHLIGDSFAD